jgi:hypothetical protein
MRQAATFEPIPRMARSKTTELDNKALAGCLQHQRHAISPQFSGRATIAFPSRKRLKSLANSSEVA